MIIEEIKSLVDQCINNIDVVELLIYLNYYINNNLNSIAITANYYDDVWIIDELNTLSRKELEFFIDILEDELVKQVKGISDSLNTKLYNSFT